MLPPGSKIQTLQELVAMLEKGGVSGMEFETKRSILNTLAEIGNPDVLPGLERVMRSRQLFNRTHHSRLKLEILKTLDRYPPAHTAQFLSWVAGSGHEELAPFARNLLRTVSGKVMP